MKYLFATLAFLSYSVSFAATECLNVSGTFESKTDFAGRPGPMKIRITQNGCESIKIEDHVDHPVYSQQYIRVSSLDGKYVSGSWGCDVGQTSQDYPYDVVVSARATKFHVEKNCIMVGRANGTVPQGKVSVQTEYYSLTSNGNLDYTIVSNRGSQTKTYERIK